MDRKMDLEKICRQAISLIKETGEFIEKENSKISQEKVQFKGKNDLVTYVDMASEKKLVQGLSDILPEAGFITEEKTSSKPGEYKWVIDPIDGTTNYVHSIPIYSISVALMNKEEIVIGIVYEICLKECFYTWKDEKVYLNNNIISVSSADSLQSSLLATGFPYSNLTLIDPYIDILKELLKKSRGIRRLGSAAVDLAYVACGRFDGFYEYRLKPWDVAAGAFLVKQAGGKVVDFKGV